MQKYHLNKNKDWMHALLRMKRSMVSAGKKDIKMAGRCNNLDCTFGDKSSISMNKPVTILTGFLGSGKTTYLNHVLQQNEGKRYAIIENEFGEAGIDNELVMRPDDSIVELNNGCLCCTLNDNLYDILNELFERRDDFDELIIEATGVADPRGLAQPFIAHPLIKKHFPLTAVVCLIDAELIEDQLEQTEEAIHQITFSDVLLINKIDLVSPEYVTSLSEMLHELNPLSSIVQGHKKDFPVLDFDSKNEKLEELFKDIATNSEGHVEESFPVHKPHSHHHKHTENVNSQTFIFDVPFDLGRLNLQLSVLLTFQSAGLYRMKGLIYLSNDEDQYILQSVGSRFDLEKNANQKKKESKQSIIVFIGKNIQRKGLQRVLDGCLSKTKSSTKS